MRSARRRSTSASRQDEARRRDHVTRARPPRQIISPIKVRPTRPLPSANGWIVSNCACAIAACSSGEMSRRLQNSHRSSRRPLDESCRRWHEIRAGRRVRVAPDPVLTGANLPGEAGHVPVGLARAPRACDRCRPSASDPAVSPPRARTHHAPRARSRSSPRLARSEPRVGVTRLDERLRKRAMRRRRDPFHLARRDRLGAQQLHGDGAHVRRCRRAPARRRSGSPHR